MPKQTFKCGYCKAEVKKGAKRCIGCGRGFGKTLDATNPLTLRSSFIAAIMMLFLGYGISLSRTPMIGIMIVLFVDVLVLIFWKKKRKIILQKEIVIALSFLVGFILGIAGFEFPKKEALIVYFLFIAWTYAGCVLVVSLKQKVRYKTYDPPTRTMAYLDGILFFGLGVFMLWANLNYALRNNAFTLFPGIFGLAFIILSFLSIYYGSQIKK